MAQQHGDLFDMAFREAQKAWHRTPMLARTRAAKAKDLVQVLSSKDTSAIARLLSDIAGPSFSAAAVTIGIDAQKAAQLGELVVQMALIDLGDASPSEKDPAAQVCIDLAALQQHLRDWVGHGATSPDCELGKVDRLLGGQPAVRLALVSPLASALGVSLVVAKALSAGFPLAGTGSKVQEASA
jgi:hypothetical protein